MITDTRLLVEIDNKSQLGCISLELSQMINGHHFFQASFHWEDIEKEPNGIGDEALKKIGKTIRIKIYNDAHHELSFNGIITSVRMRASGNSSQGQYIVIEGYSPTVLLSNGAVCQAYTDMDLYDIVSTASSGQPANILKLDISPVYKNQLNYTVQYNENSFDFIDRMARRFGEWFYYDGNELVFGDKKQPTIDLIYGSTLINFDFSMLGAPVHTNCIAHGYRNNDTQTLSSSSYQPSARGESKIIFDKSSSLWNKPLPNISMSFDDEKALEGEMHSRAQINVDGTVANMIMLHGQSINPSLYPGAIIKITGNNGYLYGSYILTEVHHSYGEAGKYSNVFTAIPVSNILSPNTNTNLHPVANTQMGIVTDNNDPAGLGRVQVQLYWQRDTTTPWLRIVMPYAGADKGMYFIPEKGEEVLVSFEGGNAEKPYVTGSMYHGKAGPDSFKNAKNDIKAIRTRSGHTVEFKDTANEESITISDKEGTMIFFNTKEKSLQIKAPEKLEILAKNITISAEEKIELLSKDNMSLASKKDVEVTSDKSLKLQSKDDTTLKSGGAATIDATKDATINGQNITMSGKVKTDIEGMQTTVSGKMTEIKGASFKIDVM